MDYKNVTFKQLFVTSFMLIMPVSLWVFPRIMSQYGGKNLILAFVLFGLYALIYVILMHSVFTVMFDVKQNTDASGTDNHLKIKFVAAISVIRYAVRTVIIMYFFVKGCKILMLPDYSDFMIAIPAFLMLIYFAGKGLKGFISFSEITFIAVVISLAFFAMCSFGNADFTRLSGFVETGLESSPSYTICSVMSKGFMMVAALAMLEFVMFMYLNIKEKKRSMLVSSVVVPLVFSMIESIFVIILLGNNFVSEGSKSILNVVGAMILPGGTNARLGLLACYIFVVSGIMLMGIHVIFICGIIRSMRDKKKKDNAKTAKTEIGKLCRNITVNGFLFRSFVVLSLFILYIIARAVFDRTNPENAVIIYIAAIDIPLSVIVPAIISRKKKHSKKHAAGVMAGILILCLLTGCGDKSIESVDFLRVVFIDKTENGTELKLVADSLREADAANEAEEIIYSVRAGSLENACTKYNLAHDRDLDLSHVEYIVACSWDTLEEFYPELMDLFVTNYIEVICDENLYIGSDSGNIREYISNHYEGECLATLDLSEK